MRLPSFSTAALLLIVACGSTPSPTSGENASFDWLIGSWSDESREAREVWWRSGDAIVGFARGENSVEFMRIANGVLTAAPKGQSVTRFTLEASGDARARFANPGHDFPKWVAYERRGSQLTARIGGAGKAAKASWSYNLDGRAPETVPLAAKLCRDADAVYVTLGPCSSCGGTLHCAEIDGQLLLAFFDNSCDGCSETRDICHTPISAAPETGCVEIRVETLVFVDTNDSL